MSCDLCYQVRHPSGNGEELDKGAIDEPLRCAAAGWIALWMQPVTGIDIIEETTGRSFQSIRFAPSN
jgi:hypothetical protein